MTKNEISPYFLKALDAYSHSLEETVEALNYALSYNDKDAHALHLMGKIYALDLQDYNTAKQYYAEAMAQCMEMHKIYPDYIRVLMWNDDFDQAQKLLDYAFKVKGIDRGLLHSLQGQLLESTRQFEKAADSYILAKNEALNSKFISFANTQLSRVKKKIKMRNKELKK